MTCVGTIVNAAALGACLVLVSACGNKAPVRQIALTECRVPKLATAAQCGKVEVPEDRDNRRTRLRLSPAPWAECAATATSC